MGSVEGEVKRLELKRPHSEKQRLMITHPGSVVALCGRRFGKTDGYVQRIFYSAMRDMREGRRPGLYWWVGLSWRSASLKRAWREMTGIAERYLRMMGHKPEKHINSVRYDITLPGLCEIWFRTADNPSSLAGESVRGAVLDEFTLMEEAVWTEYVEGTLVDEGGWAAFSGVPKGWNWAALLWNSAVYRPGWLQIQATSYDNPFIRHDRLDEIRKSVPDRLFRQEYLAEIVEDGTLFHNVNACATATEQTAALPGHDYVIGVDWGKTTDYSVFAVVDQTTSELVHLSRSNNVEYLLQRERLLSLCHAFRPRLVVAEENSNDTLIELLRRDRIPLRPFRTTSQSKSRIIENLMVAFERQEIKILPDATLLSELMAFQATALQTTIRYAAPDGMHDDCVMALALAWEAARAKSLVTYVERIF